MNILCKIPTRSRPDKFFATLDSFVQKESGEHNIHYLISIDNDDESMHTAQVKGTS